MLRDYLNLLRRHPRPLGFGLLHTFSSGPGQTYAIAVFVPALSASFAADDATMGLIYTGISLLSAVLLPSLGKLIDHVDLRRYSLAVGGAMAAACLIAASAGSLLVLAVGLFGMRLTGQGLMSHISQTATARFFGPSRGKALSVTSLGMALSEATLPPLLVVLVLFLDWRLTLVLVSITFLVVFLPANVILVRGHRIDGESAGSAESPTAPGVFYRRRDVLKSRYFRCVMPLMLMVPFFNTGVVFHQGALGLEKEWGTTAVAAWFFVFAIGDALGAFGIGPLVDQFTARRLFPLHAVPFALAMLAAVWMPPLFAVTVFLFFLGVTQGLFLTITTALWAEVYGTQNLDAIRAMASTVMIFAAAAAPGVIGAVINAGTSFDAILIAAMVYAVVTGFLAMRAGL